MSGDFLARWSRRKQAARQAEKRPGAEPDEALPAPQPNADTSEEPVATAEEEPALSAEEIETLPKLEELTPESDFSAFLRKGVPETLRNAALRRMWSLDPAIRDFVGEARDYAWDWNTPGGVPGSGELLPGQDVRAMVRQVFGESEPEPSSEPSPPAPSRHRDLEQDREREPAVGAPVPPPAVAVQPDVEHGHATAFAGSGGLEEDLRSRQASAGTDALPISAAAQQESAGDGAQRRAKPADDRAKPV